MDDRRSARRHLGLGHFVFAAGKKSRDQFEAKLTGDEKIQLTKGSDNPNSELRALRTTLVRNLRGLRK